MNRNTKSNKGSTDHSRGARHRRTCVFSVTEAASDLRCPRVQRPKDTKVEDSACGRRRRRQMGPLLRSLGRLGIFVGCLFQCASFLTIYFRYPTTVEINVVNEAVLDFPAVTVCNVSPVRYNVWCQENQSSCVRRATETIEEFRTRQRSEYDLLGKRRRVELGYSLRQIVVHAEFENETVTDGFKQYYDYEYTNCFTFNANWGTPNQSLRSAIVFNPLTGKSSELLLCVDVDVSGNRNLTANAYGRVQLAIHANDVVPNPSYDSSSIEPGNLYSFGIQKVTTKLLRRPYQTKCRNYQDEKEFRTGARMSQKNCLLECSMIETESICGCTYRRLSLMYNSRPCETREQGVCLENEEARVFKLCNTQCPMACRKIEFTFISGDVEPLRKQSSLYEKMKIEKLFPSEESMRENMACAKIHYGSTETRALTHWPKYPFIELFSLLGGYSGLWLGFSLFNLHEYILFRVINLFITPNRGKRKSTR